MGYSETSKAFRIYIPAWRRVVVRRDVTFQDKAFRRSWELEYLDQPDCQEQRSQAQGSSGQGSGGTSITVSVPSVSSGSQSQRGGASGKMQSAPQSSSVGSPLMDSSHTTSASTGTGSGRRTAERHSGVQASDEDEEFHSPVGEVCSGKRKPKWLQDTLREATSVAGLKR